MDAGAAALAVGGVGRGGPRARTNSLRAERQMGAPFAPGAWDRAVCECVFVHECHVCVCLCVGGWGTGVGVGCQ